MPDDNQQPMDQSQTSDNQQPVDPVQGQNDQQITQASALPEDNGTPAQPAADPGVTSDDTNQLTDNQSNVDAHQAYDEGTASAAGAVEPADPGVGSFTPPQTEDPNSGEEDTSNGGGEPTGGDVPAPPTAV